jgi:hypothetical protein
VRDLPLAAEFPPRPNAWPPVKVALCVFATGKYRDFLPRVFHSARRFFLPRCAVTMVAFSDTTEIPDLCHVWRRVPTTTWPDPTQLRYRWLWQARDVLLDHEYTFMVDADAEFVDVVGNEVLRELVAVRHAGFLDGSRPFPHEDRPDGAAFVPPEERTFYCCGGFQGGAARAYLDACFSMDEQLQEDKVARLEARWHDESYWNHYLTHHPPDAILPASYGCDEIDRLPGARILWLRKDHAAIRS